MIELARVHVDAGRYILLSPLTGDAEGRVPGLFPKRIFLQNLSNRWCDRYRVVTSNDAQEELQMQLSEVDATETILSASELDTSLVRTSLIEVEVAITGLDPFLGCSATGCYPR